MSRGHGPAAGGQAAADGPAAAGALPSSGPFALLGLPAGPQVTDDDVRAAWRRLAAATHPDRDDGGDPELFARAAAAYTALRTASGRGEVLADLAAPPPAGTRQPAGARPAGTPIAAAWQAVAGQAARARAGRPARLALRLLAAAAVSAGAVAVTGFSAAALGLITGALTWLIRTARRDLGPPGRP